MNEAVQRDHQSTFQLRHFTVTLTSSTIIIHHSSYIRTSLFNILF